MFTFYPPQLNPITQPSFWTNPNLFFRPTQPNPWVDPTHDMSVCDRPIAKFALFGCSMSIKAVITNQWLTSKDEGDESKHDAAQPIDETRQDYLWYERLPGVFNVHTSIASHGRQYNLPGISITNHICNTWLLWCWRPGRICQLCLS